MFNWSTGLSTDDRVLKNVENLLNLRKGTLCMDRDLGIDPSYLDKSLYDYESSVLTDAADMLADREPRAEITFSKISDLLIDTGVKINGII